MKRTAPYLVTLRPYKLPQFCKALIYISLISGATGGHISACDMSHTEIKVGKDLEVFVADRGKPLPGIEVRITRAIEKPDFHLETVASALSDAKGAVSFRKIKSGRYYIAGMHVGVEGSEAYLVVKSNRPSSRIALEWPARHILEVRNVSGILNARFFRDTGRGVLDIAYKQEGPFANEDIRLMRADSGEIVGTTRTDEHGQFGFGALDPGLYILHVKENTVPKTRHDMDIEGDIFIEVSASATDKNVPTLQLNESSCGLSYKRMEPDAPIMH